MTDTFKDSEANIKDASGAKNWERVRELLEEYEGRELDLSDTGIGNEGAVLLGEVLEVNSTLTMLDLGSNGIGDEGCVAIGSPGCVITG